MRLIVSLIVGVSAGLGTIFALSSPSAAPVPAPIVVIVMENHERSSIEGSSEADYLKSFEHNGRSFTHYNAVSHPSLPNYLAMVTGTLGGKAGSDSITSGEIPGPVLWRQLNQHHIPWGVYMEDMPSACYTGGSSGRYVLRHNPAMPFYEVAHYPNRCAKVKPFSAFSPTALPAVSFVVPNLCNDMHDCSIATGDNWLQARVPAMLSHGAIVVITFDEGSTSIGGGGNIYTAIDGPGIPGSVNTSTFTHYSLLAGIENRFGLTRLGNAAHATPLPI